MMTSSGIRGRPAARAAAALAAAVLMIAGCEGSNLFEGEVAEEGPEAILSVQDEVVSGEPFSVGVTATAPRGVRFIEVRVSGAATDSIRDEFDGTSQTESTSLSVTASLALGSQVLIEAFVQDANGRNSPVARETLIVNADGAEPGSMR